VRVEAVTPEQMQAIADQAAEKAVVKAFTTLGIPAADPIKAQALFMHLNRQFEACQTIKQHSLKTAIGTLITAITAYVLLAFGFKGTH
jgi:hypothetical protein